jgi:hypothetical protein
VRASVARLCVVSSPSVGPSLSAASYRPPAISGVGTLLLLLPMLLPRGLLRRARARRRRGRGGRRQRWPTGAGAGARVCRGWVQQLRFRSRAFVPWEGEVVGKDVEASAQAARRSTRLL